MVCFVITILNDLHFSVEIWWPRTPDHQTLRLGSHVLFLAYIKSIRNCCRSLANVIMWKYLSLADFILVYVMSLFRYFGRIRYSASINTFYFWSTTTLKKNIRTLGRKDDLHMFFFMTHHSYRPTYNKLKQTFSFQTY